MVWQMIRPALNKWRRKMGLRPHGTLFGYYTWMRQRKVMTIYGFSPLVLSPPTDWPDGHHIAGYWFLVEPADWQPPADLLKFLEAGPPPVYVGFGSMDDQNPERISQIVVEALRLSGQRGVMVSGWGGLGAITLPETIYRLDSIPHSWLFPHMAALVHHGGAGTTAAGLRAGIPAVITPFAADQPFWAGRVARLGVGIRGANFFRLTADGLAAAITQAVNDSEMRQRAASLGDQLRAENGVAKAVEIIDDYLIGKHVH
jgi:UDP:flavonoid glycosyltransferase YjiC (YdhE family)